MGTNSFRVLIVDDYEPWRSFVHSTVRRTPHLQVVCQESDGWEAVQKAGEFQPDWIVLDIGLPTLNGVDAARANPRACPVVQDAVCKPGIFCRCCAGGFQSWGVGLPGQNGRAKGANDRSGCRSSGREVYRAKIRGSRFHERGAAPARPAKNQGRCLERPLP